MAVVYLISVFLLWAGLMLMRRNEGKQNFPVWLICTAMLTICAEAFFGGLLGKAGLPVSVTTIGIMNLIACGLCGLWIRKNGIQRYTLCWQDIIGVAVVTGIAAVFAIGKHGTDLHIDFISVDASVHAAHAKEVALEHRIPVNLFLTAVPTGLMTEAYLALTGVRAFESYHMFVLCENIFAALSGLIFWALLRQRCGNGKWQLLLPVLVVPFYWAGYPVYSSLFGFSYLGMTVNVIILLLILLDQYVKEETNRTLLIIFLNLALFGVMVGYTLFVPTAFFGAFITILLQIRKKGAWKLFGSRTILEMLKVFLVPSVLGMLYAFVNLQHATPAGGAINMEGGCYNEIQSNFILMIPFVILGLYFLIAQKKGTYVLPMFTVHAVFMAVLFAGLLMRKVSVYYYGKNNSILWMLAWLVLSEGVLAMMKKCKAALLFPLLFYGVLFMAKYGEDWVVSRNPLAYRVRSSGMVDLVLINNAYFNFPSEMNPETMELYRYVDEHCEPGRVIGVHFELQNDWLRTLTGQDKLITYAGEKELREMVETEGADYICAGTKSGAYMGCKPYLDQMEVVFENGEGRIYRIPEELKKATAGPEAPKDGEKNE